MAQIEQQKPIQLSALRRSSASHLDLKTIRLSGAQMERRVCKAETVCAPLKAATLEAARLTSIELRLYLAPLGSPVLGWLLWRIAVR